MERKSDAGILIPTLRDKTAGLSNFYSFPFLFSSSVLNVRRKRELDLEITSKSIPMVFFQRARF